MRNTSVLPLALTLLLLAPAARAGELSPAEEAWGRAVGEALGEPVRLEKRVFDYPARGEPASPGKATSLRAIGKTRQVERAKLPRADLTFRTSALIGPEDQEAPPRVGEACGLQLVTVTGPLGDAGWARRLLDVAWSTLRKPEGPTTTTFVVRGELDIAMVFAAAEGKIARSIQEGLAQCQQELAAGQGSDTLVQIGPNEFRTTGKRGAVLHSGSDRSGRVWSIRGVGLAGEAALETYLARLGVTLPKRS